MTDNPYDGTPEVEVEVQATAEAPAAPVPEVQVEKAAPKKINPPKEGSVSARIWQLADHFYAQDPASFAKNVRATVEQENLNPATCNTQMNRWKQYQKQEGKWVEPPKPEPAPKPEKKEEDPAAE